MGSVLRFYTLVIRIGFLQALTGQLKSCTLTLMALAAERTEIGMISYLKFTRLLTR